MRRPLGKRPVKTSTIRSELRALEVLEYFSRVSDEARVTEIARALNLPQSSTSRLLANLAEAGYLVHDRARRTFHPSARVALLSMRTMARLFGQGHLLDMMDELAALTRGPVLLTARSDAKLNVVHLVLPEGVGALCYDVGLARPLVASASGRLILRKHADGYIQGLVRRYNAEAPLNERIDPRRYLEEVNEARRRGYIVYPLPDAMRMLASRCRRTQFGEDAQCCLARGGPYMGVPVHTGVGDDLAVLVTLPCDVRPEEHPAHAARVHQVIVRHMTSVAPEGQGQAASA